MRKESRGVDEDGDTPVEREGERERGRTNRGIKKEGTKKGFETARGASFRALLSLTASRLISAATTSFAPPSLLHPPSPFLTPLPSSLSVQRVIYILERVQTVNSYLE